MRILPMLRSCCIMNYVVIEDISLHETQFAIRIELQPGGGHYFCRKRLLRMLSHIT